MGKKIINLSFKTEVYQPVTKLFGQIRREIDTIDKLCFPKTYFLRDSSVFSWFKNPRNIIVLLKQDKFIRGFAVARPVNDIFPQRNSELDNCNLSVIAIHPDFQHQGLAALLMMKLTEELMRCDYKFLEMNALVNDGWAQKIIKVYSQQITETGRPRETKFGLQQYFKIKFSFPIPSSREEGR